MKKHDTQLAIAVCCLVFCCLCLFFLVLFAASTLLQKNTLEGDTFSPQCWVPKGRDYCAPQFIIAGSMKCGTTSLWAYLINHPDILPLKKVQIDPKKMRTVLAEKEVRFFNDGAYKQLSKEYGFEKAMNYYLDLFYEIPPHPDCPEHPELFGKITGEASPMYISNRGVSQRIRDALPEVKIIVMLRNPIDRAYSDYWFRKNLKIRPDSIGRFDVSGLTHSEIFEQCIEIEMEIIEHCKYNEFRDDPSLESLDAYIKCYKTVSRHILKSDEASETCTKGPLAKLCIPDSIRTNCQNSGLEIGMYFGQVFEWLSVFPREQMLFIQSEEFYSNTTEVMQRVGKFLGVSDFEWDDFVSTTFNIINPNSVAGSKQNLFTNNQEAKNSLQIGASNSTSEYPPLDPIIRSKLNQMMSPYNHALAKILKDDRFRWEE